MFEKNAQIDMVLAGPHFKNLAEKYIKFLYLSAALIIFITYFSTATAGHLYYLNKSALSVSAIIREVVLLLHASMRFIFMAIFLEHKRCSRRRDED